VDLKPSHPKSLLPTQRSSSILLPYTPSNEISQYLLNPNPTTTRADQSKGQHLWPSYTMCVLFNSNTNIWSSYTCKYATVSCRKHLLQQHAMLSFCFTHHNNSRCAFKQNSGQEAGNEHLTSRDIYRAVRFSCDQLATSCNNDTGNMQH
jgi:hypothetical protein